MIIESYVNFHDKPLFYPMINPYDMINYGIHEGCIIHPEFGIMDAMPDRALDTIHSRCNPQKYASSPNPAHNFYKIIEEVPPFQQFSHGKLIESRDWYLWYIGMYLGERCEYDDVMIAWWATVVDWGMNKAPKTHAVDQMLLHYSHNPGFNFKGKLSDYANT